MDFLSVIFWSPVEAMFGCWVVAPIKVASACVCMRTTEMRLGSS